MKLSVIKVMYDVSFRCTGLIKAIKFEVQNTVMAKWYDAKCLPKNFQEVYIRGLVPRLDNASSYSKIDSLLKKITQNQ